MKPQEKTLARQIIITILQDLRSGEAYFRPTTTQLCEWFNLSAPVVWEITQNCFKNEEDRQLWKDKIFALSRNNELIRYVKEECRVLAKHRAERGATVDELTTWFEMSNIHDTYKLLGSNLTENEKNIRKLHCRKRKGPDISYHSDQTKAIVRFSETALNDYLHGRSEILPNYTEIGKLANPAVTRQRVGQILPNFLPPEAIAFWSLDKFGNWKKIAGFLLEVERYAKKYFDNPDYFLPPVTEMAENHKLDVTTGRMAIASHLSKEIAALWGVESKTKASKQVRNCVEFMVEAAKKHRDDPSSPLPTYKQMADKFDTCQANVGRMLSHWVPPELAALWGNYKSNPRPR